MPGSRIYIVTSPALAAAVQRSTKALSFTPLVPDITKRVLGLDHDAIKIVRQNLDPGSSDPRGYLADVQENMYGSLGPGPYLEELSVKAVQELIGQLAGYQARNRDNVNLLNWIRDLVATGTANYLLGPNNPMQKEPGLAEDFWAFDHGLGGLLIGVMPSLTAAKAYRGRERFVAALKEYYRAGHHRDAARILQDRCRIEQQWNLSEDMTARSALSFLFAGIVNTTTTTFWVVLRIFADPGLLLEVRAEVEDALIASNTAHGRNHISITQLRNRCPLLTSVYRECLRLGSENSSVRLVKEDTLLSDRYHLRKGSIVQIAGGAIHANQAIWGEDAESFNPRRFLSEESVREGTSHKASGADRASRSFHPAAFRGFGGGKTLCPGRHFATNEIVCFAAIIIRCFDITGADGRAPVVPSKNDRVLPVHILEPKASESPMVNIKSRPEADELSDCIVVS